MCGGTLEINNNETVGVCEYCGTKQTLPRLDDDKKTNLYDRANHFRRSNDFDKAMGIYEQILNGDKTDAEAYWSLVLCRYGIEYVEDPSTHKRVPTVNRAQFTPVFADEDYKSAIQYADDNQKQVYEQEAKAIDEIQKGILSISQKEKPFDIFICYKETDNTGRRTQDSVLANDLYHQLTQEGFKVFFSRITLEDKIGTAYEPYIFAALNSAKVMVVLGTKPEYFNAVWVKNEWSRYLALIKKSGGKKVLIPAYRDMDPYDLPEEFSHLQAQDMSKLGFMQDLIRGIKKIVNADSEKSTVKETVVMNSGNVSPLLRRVFLFLEDKNWQEADEYCEKVLDLDPENAMAYVGKLMAELQVSKEENLANCEEPFDNSNNYQKAVRFADDELKTKLVGYVNTIKDRNEERKRMEEERRLNALYNEALEMITKAKNRDIDYLNKAVRILMHISSYKDSEQILQNCLEEIDELKEKEIETNKNTKYDVTKRNMDDCNTIESYNKIIESFTELDGWKDSKQQIEICKQKIEKIEEEQRQQKIKEQEEQAKHKAKIARIRKRVIIGVSAFASLALIFVIILNTVIIPNQKLDKFNKAIEVLDSGDYDAAYALLEEIGDSEAIDANRYDRAIKYVDSGDYEPACTLLEGLSYKDSKDKLLSIKSRYEQHFMKKANVGDKVSFGKYEQDNQSSNGKENIEWIVLAKKDDKILIVSDKALDCKEYNTYYGDFTWKSCSLRAWLNKTFFDAAFSIEEQAVIKNTNVKAAGNPKNNTDSGNDTTDKVFLLSINEVNKYLDSDGTCVPTEYAIAQGAKTSYKDDAISCWWWLRSPGYRQDFASLVDYDGSVNVGGYYGDHNDVCVRPALWVNLDS